jgi:hypothetical protein
MGRLLLFAVLLYGYGDPGFEGHRPAPVDRALRDFHAAVDTTAREAQRILVALDNGTPRLRRLGDGLRRIGEALVPTPD